MSGIQLQAAWEPHQGLKGRQAASGAKLLAFPSWAQEPASAGFHASGFVRTHTGLRDLQANDGTPPPAMEAGTDDRPAMVVFVGMHTQWQVASQNCIY